MKNIYYFRHINALGGIETFFYELAKKYKDWDLTIVYSSGDSKQVKRLSKYVRCIRDDKKAIYECDEAFFNFNLDIIDRIKSKRNTLVVHGNYHMLDGKPPIHEKINRVVAVSNDSAEAYTELTGIPCEVCYNPLSVEKPTKIVRLISASRLKDKVKGFDRMATLIRRMDAYCKATGNKYVWTIFSDNNGAINSENVCYLSPRLDIRDYIADSDFLVQLSDNFEGYNYSVNESLSLSTPVVITDCNVYRELGIDDTMSIRLDFDLKNIDSVIDQIFNKKFKFNYTPPKDRWDELLAYGKSTYEGEIEVKIKALRTYYDTVENIHVTTGQVYETSIERARLIAEKKYGEIVEEAPKKKTTTRKKK